MDLHRFFGPSEPFDCCRAWLGVAAGGTNGNKCLYERKSTDPGREKAVGKTISLDVTSSVLKKPSIADPRVPVPRCCWSPGRNIDRGLEDSAI